MDWALVIKKNRDALLAIVAQLIALAGQGADAAHPRLSRPVHRAILRLLRPAESALRRLIIIAARHIKRPSLSSVATPLPDFSQFGAARAQSLPRFRLIDPRKQFKPSTGRHFAKIAPRISVPGFCDPQIEPVIDARPEDRTMNAKDIARRLNAMQHALDDLPRQARRLTRLEAARLAQSIEKPPRLAPIRPGLPPGYRKRRLHAVDDILFETDLLARELAQHAPPRGPTVSAQPV